ncbi:hypothetical protein M3J09_009766 [Ascochyta lentis]
MSCHSATKTWSTTHVPSPPTTEPRQLSFESHSTSRRPTNPPTDPQIHPPSPLPHKASERANHRFLHTTHGSTPVTPSPTGKKRACIHHSRDPMVSTAGRNRQLLQRPQSVAFPCRGTRTHLSIYRLTRFPFRQAHAPSVDTCVEPVVETVAECCKR